MEAVSNKRHFWWQWLHGHKRNNAQNKAAAAAEARAQDAQVADHNSFDVLAEQPNSQVGVTCCDQLLQEAAELMAGTSCQRADAYEASSSASLVHCFLTSAPKLFACSHDVDECKTCLPVS